MKKVLCVDWGNVLFEFDGRFLERFLKRGRKKILLRDFVNKHDRDLISAFGFYEGLKSGGHFRKDVKWTEFVYAYSQCLVDINLPMFDTLKNLKEKGLARLVTTSDNNHFCFNLTSLFFPEAVDLFIENGQELFILSHFEHSLKRDKNPFVRACSKYGFSPKDAAIIDDKEYNFEAAARCGYDRDACFLYKINDAKNHAQFEKFIAKHFPA